jgi:transcriptional regulator with XRE-family HTH domain
MSDAEFLAAPKAKTALGKGKAVEGIRALRERMAREIPAFALAVDLDDRAESFCREVRNDLRDERKKQQLDQSVAAKRLDMTQSAISKIENGEGDLGLKTVFRYAHALGLRPVCMFVPDSDRLFPSEVHSTQAQAVRAAQEFQLGLVRATCNTVSHAVASLARAFDK